MCQELLRTNWAVSLRIHESTIDIILGFHRLVPNNFSFLFVMVTYGAGTLLKLDARALKQPLCSAIAADSAGGERVSAAATAPHALLPVWISPDEATKTQPQYIVGWTVH